MPISDVLTFAKSNDIPVSSVQLSPLFDEKKGRVSKGKAKANFEWNKKGRWELKNTKCTPGTNTDAYCWFFDLKRAEMYVIDIDPSNGLTAKDSLKPLVYDNLINASDYVIETGSGGLHAYFKLPELEEGDKINPKIKADVFKQWFIDEENGGEVDILTNIIIAEGSSYSFEDVTYSYKCITGGQSINDVRESDQMWDEVKDIICFNPEKEKRLLKEAKERQKEEARQQKENVLSSKDLKKLEKQQEQAQKELEEQQQKNSPISFDELCDHMDNIPGDKATYDEWYKMAQTLYNILDDADVGYELFKKYSSTYPRFNESETYKLWRGLSKRDMNSRTVGSILYLSRLANEVQYNIIRSKYQPLSYKSIKQLIEEDHFMIEEPSPEYIRIRNRGIVAYTPTQCRDLFAHFRFHIDSKPVSFFESWKVDSTKRKYKRMGYYTNAADCPKDEYNMYVPPEASFIPANKDSVSVSHIQPIIDHINLLTDEVDSPLKPGSDFALDFLAHIIQKPDELAGMALLFYGQEGVGKDIIFDWFGDYVLGSHLYNKPGNIANVFKGFNAKMKGKQLIHTDEIDSRTIKLHIENLKRIITSGKIEIEKKGKDATEEKSYTRFIMTTNNRDALQISPTDRRFVVFHSSSAKVSDMAYFKTLLEFIKKPTSIRYFYEFLMQRDISKFNHTNRPKTKLYNEMRKSSIDPIMQWIHDSDGFDEGRRKTTEWLTAYNNWATIAKVRYHTVTSFGTTMTTWIEKECGITKQIPKNISHLTIDKEKVIAYLVKEGLIDEADDSE